MLKIRISQNLISNEQGLTLFQNNENHNTASNEGEYPTVSVSSPSESIHSQPIPSSSTSVTPRRRNSQSKYSKSELSILIVFQNYLEHRNESGVFTSRETDDPIIHCFVSMGKIVNTFTSHRHVIMKEKVLQVIKQFEIDNEASPRLGYAWNTNHLIPHSKSSTTTSSN